MSNTAHREFDRDNPGSQVRDLSWEIEPFGVIRFDETGQIVDPKSHDDFVKFVKESLASVPVGYAGFIIERSGNRFFFDSLGCLVNVEAGDPTANTA